MSSKQEALEWIEVIMKEVAERKEGEIPYFVFNFKKSTEEHGVFRAVAGILSLVTGYGFTDLENN